ncbi:MAG: hypothetical protein AAGF32_03110 [Pseudomonadota bacterium]
MDYKVRVLEDHQQDEPGYAWIDVTGPGHVPFQEQFELQPGEGDGAKRSDDAWPNGPRKPLEVERTDDGLRLLIGPDLVGHGGLLPGTPVRIVLTGTSVQGDVVWPVLTLPMRSRRQRLIGSSQRRKGAGNRAGAAGLAVGASQAARPGRTTSLRGLDARPDDEVGLFDDRTGSAARAPEPQPGQPAQAGAARMSATFDAANPAGGLGASSGEAQPRPAAPADPYAMGAAAGAIPADTRAIASAAFTGVPSAGATGPADPSGGLGGHGSRAAAGAAAQAGAGELNAGQLGTGALGAQQAGSVPPAHMVPSAAGSGASGPINGARRAYTFGFVALIGLLGALIGAGGNLLYIAAFGVPQQLSSLSGSSGDRVVSPYRFLTNDDGTPPSSTPEKLKNVASMRAHAATVVRLNAEEGSYWLKWTALSGLKDTSTGFARTMTDLGNALALHSADPATLQLARNFWELGWAGKDCGALRNLATVHYASGPAAAPLDAAQARPWLEKLIKSCPEKDERLGTAGPSAQLFASELPANSIAGTTGLGGLFEILGDPAAGQQEASFLTASVGGVTPDQLTNMDVQDMLVRADQALFDGKGEGSREEAGFWLREAVTRQLGRPDVMWALTQLGKIEANKASTPQDFARVHQIWELASALGDPVATCFLRELHKKDLITGGDSDLVASIDKRAAKAGGCS